MLVSAVLLELSLRLYAPRSHHPFFLPESTTNPETVEFVLKGLEARRGKALHGVPFNSLGFRDEEFRVPKPGDVFRIVALADSFGVIANVPDTHHHLKLLERDLQGFAGVERVEVANLGVSATGPSHHLAILERFGVPLQPDLVSTYLFLGNDFTDQVLENVFRSRWDHLLTYRLTARLCRLLAARPETPSSEPRRSRDPVVPGYVEDWRLEPPTMPREEFLRIELHHSSRVLTPGSDAGAFQRPLADLLRIRDVARQVTGRPLVVVLIPDEVQVNPELRREIETRLGTALDVEKPNRFLERFLRENGMVAIDLLPALSRAQTDLGRVYHLQNTHWNANGNRVAAREVARQLLLRPELGAP